VSRHVPGFGNQQPGGWLHDLANPGWQGLLSVGQDALLPGRVRAVNRELVWPFAKKAFYHSPMPEYFPDKMSTVAEIEAAIRALSPAERERLADDLPSILPELNGDAQWHRIVRDERPRPALSALGDEIAARLKASPATFSEIHDADFDEPK
jgi:hypothetical protein